jgi:hypothetical protein
MMVVTSRPTFVGRAATRMATERDAARRVLGRHLEGLVAVSGAGCGSGALVSDGDGQLSTRLVLPRSLVLPPPRMALDPSCITRMHRFEMDGCFLPVEAEEEESASCSLGRAFDPRATPPCWFALALSRTPLVVLSRREGAERFRQPLDALDVTLVLLCMDPHYVLTLARAVSRRSGALRLGGFGPGVRSAVPGTVLASAAASLMERSTRGSPTWTTTPASPAVMAIVTAARDALLEGSLSLDRLVSALDERFRRRLVRLVPEDSGGLRRDAVLCLLTSHVGLFIVSHPDGRWARTNQLLRARHDPTAFTPQRVSHGAGRWLLPHDDLEASLTVSLHKRLSAPMALRSRLCFFDAECKRGPTFCPFAHSVEHGMPPLRLTRAAASDPWSEIDDAVRSFAAELGVGAFVRVEVDWLLRRAEECVSSTGCERLVSLVRNGRQSWTGVGRAHLATTHTLASLPCVALAASWRRATLTALLSACATVSSVNAEQPLGADVTRLLRLRDDASLAERRAAVASAKSDALRALRRLSRDEDDHHSSEDGPLCASLSAVVSHKAGRGAVIVVRREATVTTTPVELLRMAVQVEGPLRDVWEWWLSLNAPVCAFVDDVRDAYASDESDAGVVAAWSDYASHLIAAVEDASMVSEERPSASLPAAAATAASLSTSAKRRRRRNRQRASPTNDSETTSDVASLVSESHDWASLRAVRNALSRDGVVPPAVRAVATRSMAPAVSDAPSLALIARCIPGMVVQTSTGTSLRMSDAPSPGDPSIAHRVASLCIATLWGRLGGRLASDDPASLIPRTVASDTPVAPERTPAAPASTNTPTGPREPDASGVERPKATAPAITTTITLGDVPGSDGPLPSRWYRLGERVEVHEGEQVEYKGGLQGGVRRAIPRICPRYLVGFLNCRGGRLVFGVADDGLVQGVCLSRSDRDSLSVALESVKHSGIGPPGAWLCIGSPTFVPLLAPASDGHGWHPVSDACVVELSVFPPHNPSNLHYEIAHRGEGKGRSGGHSEDRVYWVRDGSSTRRMSSPQEIAEWGFHRGRAHAMAVRDAGRTMGDDSASSARSDAALRDDASSSQVAREDALPETPQEASSASFPESSPHFEEVEVRVGPAELVVVDGPSSVALSGASGSHYLMAVSLQQVAMRNGVSVVVRHVRESSPLSASGLIRAGALLLSVNGKSVDRLRGSALRSVLSPGRARSLVFFSPFEGVGVSAIGRRRLSDDGDATLSDDDVRRRLSEGRHSDAESSSAFPVSRQRAVYHILGADGGVLVTSESEQRRRQRTSGKGSERTKPPRFEGVGVSPSRVVVPVVKSTSDVAKSDGLHDALEAAEAVRQAMESAPAPHSESGGPKVVGAAYPPLPLLSGGSSDLRVVRRRSETPGGGWSRFFKPTKKQPPPQE